MRTFQTRDNATTFKIVDADKMDRQSAEISQSLGEIEVEEEVEVLEDLREQEKRQDQDKLQMIFDSTGTSSAATITDHKDDELAEG